MTSTLINDLKKADVQLWVDRDQLKFRAPHGVLTPTLLDAMRCHKDELIRHLSNLPKPYFHDGYTLVYPIGSFWDRRGIPGTLHDLGADPKYLNLYKARRFSIAIKTRPDGELTLVKFYL